MSLDFLKDDGVFLPMLNDVGRNNFYKSAIDLAAPGKVVCDIGAGTGLLSLLAVNAGAKHVIAVERDQQRFEYLTQMLDRVNYSDKIELVHAEFLDTDIAADVYVSETINTQIFGEDMLKLSNWACRYGGEFIPEGVRIWAEAYEDHPVFILDLLHSEAYDFSPDIDINADYLNAINADFASQYNLQDTVFTANQMNKLFTLLDRFEDLKLKLLHRTQPIDVKIDAFTNEDDVRVTIPNLATNNNVMVILKWQMYYKNVTLDSDRCWFGNVAKPIHKQFSSGGNVTFRYDSLIKNWRLQY